MHPSQKKLDLVLPKTAIFTKLRATAFLQISVVKESVLHSISRFRIPASVSVPFALYSTVKCFEGWISQILAWKFCGSDWNRRMEGQIKQRKGEIKSEAESRRWHRSSGPFYYFLPFFILRIAVGRRGKRFRPAARPLCPLHSRRCATAADVPQRRFLPSGKECESTGSLVIFLIFDAKFHYLRPQKNVVTPTLH